MKKALCLLLAIIMLVGLCGCVGGDESEDVRGDIVSGNQNENQNADDPEFSLGKAANNTYTNNFLGISCTLPEEWVFYTDEEILALNNMTGDYFDDDALETLKNASIIYDMYAATATNDKSININLQKLTSAQLMTLDIKASLEAQFDTVKSAYENMGYSNVNVYCEKVTVDGEEFDALILTANYQDMDFYGKTLSFRRGDYLASLSVSSSYSDQTDTILDYFTVK